MKKVYLLAFVWLVALQGCESPKNDSSNVKILGGDFIKPSTVDKLPGVMNIISTNGGNSGSGCTATAVSDNTLVTAYHCVDGTSQTCLIKDGGGQGKCSRKVYHHPVADGEVNPNDIAVVVFENGTFGNYFPMESQSAKVSDGVIMVGFSEIGCDQRCDEFGTKRWAKNKIASLREGGMIRTLNGNNLNAGGTSEGDSGGPLFNDQCRLIGTLSGGKVGYIDSLYPNLTEPNNQNWIRSVEKQGAYFCGLTGSDGSRCAAGRQAVPNNANDKFPCDSNGTGGGTTQPPSSGSLFVRLDSSGTGSDDQAIINVSVPAESEVVELCEASNAYACTSPGTTGYMKLDLIGTSDGRKFFKTPRAVAMRNGLVLSAIAKKPDGNATASRTLSIVAASPSTN